MNAKYNVAVVGATGAVGEEMLKILEERDFPIKNLRLLASSRSEGRSIKFAGESLRVEDLHKASLEGIEIALFSAGTSVSRQYAPLFTESGAVVVDNSAAFRMDKDIPLVVPEVNPEALRNHQGIIANPNCSTIQLVVAINPLHQQARIKRIIVCTLQSVSGTGRGAIAELRHQSEQYLRQEPIIAEVYPHQIAFNLLPHIGEFLPNGYTSEEMKLLHETRKILQDDAIRVTATCVRVPVFISHSEAVTLETEKRITAQQAREILRRAPGVIVRDNPSRRILSSPGGRDR